MVATLRKLSRNIFTLCDRFIWRIKSMWIKYTRVYIYRITIAMLYIRMISFRFFFAFSRKKEFEKRNNRNQNTNQNRNQVDLLSLWKKRIIELSAMCEKTNTVSSDFLNWNYRCKRSFQLRKLLHHNDNMPMTTGVHCQFQLKISDETVFVFFKHGW